MKYYATLTHFGYPIAEPREFDSREEAQEWANEAINELFFEIEEEEDEEVEYRDVTTMFEDDEEVF